MASSQHAASLLLPAGCAVAAVSPNPRQPASAARMPLNIPIGRQSSSQDAAGAGPSTTLQQRQDTARQRQRQPSVDDSDVVIVSSGSESDDDVVITGFKPARKRPRLSPQQPSQPQQQQQQAPQQQQAGHRVERGLHGGYFVMPTWGGQQQPAAPQPPPREASPEPMFKCLVCLDGIKPDNMGITSCGCVCKCSPMLMHHPAAVCAC